MACVLASVGTRRFKRPNEVFHVSVGAETTEERVSGRAGYSRRCLEDHRWRHRIIHLRAQRQYAGTDTFLAVGCAVYIMSSLEMHGNTTREHGRRSNVENAHRS